MRESAERTRNGEPIVLAQIIRLNRTYRDQLDVTVDCGHCGLIHTHGWMLDDPPEVMSHRVSHCGSFEGYWLTLDLAEENLRLLESLKRDAVARRPELRAGK